VSTSNKTQRDQDSLATGNPGKLRVKDFAELDATDPYKTVTFIRRVDEILYNRRVMTEEYFMRCILPLRLTGMAESIWVTDGGQTTTW
jgi:hypothetical protein